MDAPALPSNIHAILLKELRAVVRSPLFYVLCAAFLGLSGYFFYTDTLYFNLLNDGKVGLTQGLWQRFFQDMRLCILVVAPVLAARVFAEERRLGTLELLMTYPMTEAELVIGKFLALLVLFLPLIMVTALYPLVLATTWPVQFTPLFATYLGAALLTIACLALAMCCSAVASQQSSAALASFGLLFLLWFLTWNESALSSNVLEALRRISLFDRFYDFTRGTVQSRDVIYFLLFAAMLVVLTTQSLSWSWCRNRPQTSLRMFLLLAIAVAVDDLAVRHNRTWEFVGGPESLLSAATSDILKDLRTPVRLLLFYEPGRYRETAYLAEKFARQSPLVTTQLVDLDREPTLARRYRVTGYGAVVVESGKNSQLAFPSSEESIRRTVAIVTDARPRMVCLSTGHGEREMQTQQRTEQEEANSLGELVEQLGYRWQEVLLASDVSVPAECRILMVNGPSGDFAEGELERLGRFVETGGSVLFLLDPTPLPRVEGFLRNYDVLAGDEIVADAPSRLYLRDRLTLPVIAGSALMAHSNLQFSAVLYHARRIEYSARAQMAPSHVFLGYESTSLGLIPVGVALDAAPGRGRLMVVGDSDFLADKLFRRPSNQALFVTMLSWLVDHKSFQLPRDAAYAFAALTQVQAHILLSAALAPMLVFVFAGAAVWWRRLND